MQFDSVKAHHIKDCYIFIDDGLPRSLVIFVDLKPDLSWVPVAYICK
jgi:hypothetical protein